MVTKPDVFEHANYLTFLRDTIRVNSKNYGFKAQIAEAAGCQRSYLSQVLKEKAHFTVEHAVGVSSLFKFTQEESNHFIEIVLFARAANQETRKYFRERIEKSKRDRENLAKRISEKTVLPDDSAAIFYSQWQYLAMAILVTIPKFRTLSAIVARLQLPEEVVRQSLEQLMNLGVLIRKGSEWHPTTTAIHIPRESPFNSLNHTHWRQKAVTDSFNTSGEGVHYTSVCSVSLEDAAKLKAMVFRLIDESRAVISPSKEEELFCLTCDWFRV